MLDFSAVVSVSLFIFVPFFFADMRNWTPTEDDRQRVRIFKNCSKARMFWTAEI
jgi:hypothetical protein